MGGSAGSISCISVVAKTEQKCKNYNIAPDNLKYFLIIIQYFLSVVITQSKYIKWNSSYDLLDIFTAFFHEIGKITCIP